MSSMSTRCFVLSTSRRSPNMCPRSSSSRSGDCLCYTTVLGDVVASTLVTAGKKVQRLVEECADSGVEVLEALQVHRQHVIAIDPGEGRLEETMVANVPAEVPLENGDGGDDRAQR